MSSVFWLGDTAVLGLGSRSHTSRNLERTRECVINLPSAAMVDQVTSIHPMNVGDAERDGNTILYEVRVTRVLVHESIRPRGFGTASIPTPGTRSS